MNPTTEAFNSLLMMAQMAGMPAAAPPPPVVPLQVATVVSGRAADYQRLLAVPLQTISQRQENVFVARSVGDARLELAAAINPDNLSIKVRQGGKTAAWSVDELLAGVDADLPAGRYRLVLDEQWVLRIASAMDPDLPAATVTVTELLESLYAASMHLRFEPVEYAVLYEDGSLVPSSVALLRKARDGQIWVTYKQLDELSAPRWFVSIDGTWYGMMLEGPDLVFYSRPPRPARP